MNRETKRFVAFFISLIIFSAVAFTQPAYAELKIVPYGFVKFESQYNSKNTGSFPSPDINDMPYNTDLPAQHSELIIDARFSRVGMRGTEDWKCVKFLGIIEGDFYTPNGNALSVNSRVFRLRMAYAKAALDSGFFFLGGQYRSLMQNIDIAVTDIIDENGPSGASSLRQPQFRIGYQHDLCDWGKVMFEATAEKHSLNPLGFYPADNDRDARQGAQQKLPYFVGKFTWLTEYLDTEVAGSITKSYIVLNAAGRELDTRVWGVHTASTLKIKPFSLYWRGYYLSGLSRLVYPRLRDCVIVGTDLIPVHAVGGYIGARYEVNKFLSINSVAGWAQERKVPGSVLVGIQTYRARSLYLNFIYKFWSRWKTGLEYQFDDLLSYDGTRGQINILHAALWFYF